MLKIKIPRRWFFTVIGLADWRQNAQELPYTQYKELQAVIENYVSRVYKTLRKRGAMVGSLFWSKENLAPFFILEATRENEKFLKETKILIQNISEKIHSSLTIEEKQSDLGKNILQVLIEGRMLILDCTLPLDPGFFPNEGLIAKAFSDALKAELLTIKRAEHDFEGRKEWLSTLDSIINRNFLKDVGPVSKLKEAKTIEGKRLYEKKSPGDFEKISRILSEAIPYRPSLFEVEKSTSTYDTREPLGHIIIQYLSTGGNLPIRLDKRSVTHDRIGRKIEDLDWVRSMNLDWKEIDKLQLYSEEIIYDRVEKVISDVGGIKFDAFWTDKELSNNIYFLSKFDFSEDILKKLNEFVANPRQQMEEHVGPGTSAMYDLWQKAGLEFNLLIFEVKGIDADEDKNFIDWIKSHKIKEIPGPTYCGNKEVLHQRNFRPF